MKFEFECEFLLVHKQDVMYTGCVPVIEGLSYNKAAYFQSYSPMRVNDE